METIAKLIKVNHLLDKLGLTIFSFEDKFIKEQAPKTRTCVQMEGYKKGLRIGETTAITYKPGQLTLSVDTLPTIKGSWRAPDGEAQLVINKTVDVNEFATVTRGAIVDVNDVAKESTHYEVILTDEIIDVLYVHLKKLYAIQVEKEIIQKMAATRLKDEGFV
jgi:hypothetical protein